MLIRIEPTKKFKPGQSPYKPPPRDIEKGYAMAETMSASASPEHNNATAPTSTSERSEMANKLVDRFALWSGVAGLIPIPVVDVLAVGGLQIQMLRRLSQIYDVQFSGNRGKALIARSE